MTQTKEVNKTMTQTKEVDIEVLVYDTPEKKKGCMEEITLIVELKPNETNYELAQRVANEIKKVIK